MGQVVAIPRTPFEQQLAEIRLEAQRERAATKAAAREREAADRARIWAEIEELIADHQRTPVQR
jgi:hypothetical protein